MIETLPAHPAPIAVGVVIAIVVAGRLHTSDRWWCPTAAWFWWPLRRLVWPIFDVVLERYVAPLVPFPTYAKTTVSENEVVTEPLDITLEELHEDVAAAEYEAQPLSSVARFDADSDREIAGELERSSLARYHGPKICATFERIAAQRIVDAVPEWLRKRQVHLRPFGDDGEIVPTGHDEYNAWNPLFAFQHLLGIGLDASAGVRKIREDLGLEAPNPVGK